MRKINAENFLKNLSSKEKDLQNTLENLTPGDLSESGRREMIERVESMIEKMEYLKAKLKEEIPQKKTS